MSREEPTQAVPAAVICQHNTDGRIIPFRFRIKDEDGEYHVYTIKEYKDLSHRGVFTNPDGVEARTDVYEFECEITVFKKRRRVKLLYKSSAYASEWSVCL